ncbi:MAG: hypothetical protein HY904_16475 [Deltaproteobacteria bacterium]|nr:hypothetical protein [Deltaproteobacteria bacterium]
MTMLLAALALLTAGQVPDDECAKQLRFIRAATGAEKDEWTRRVIAASARRETAHDPICLVGAVTPEDQWLIPTLGELLRSPVDSVALAAHHKLLDLFRPQAADVYAAALTDQRTIPYVRKLILVDLAWFGLNHPTVIAALDEKCREQEKMSWGIFLLGHGGCREEGGQCPFFVEVPYICSRGLAANTPLKRHDLINSVDGTVFKEGEDLLLYLSSRSSAVFEVERGGKVMTFKITREGTGVNLNSRGHAK